jgi:dipeptidyl aminopeptidase/acylaminoacyl peptidase
MDDLRRRFATLDGVVAPDLWDDVGRRVAGSTTGRVGATVRSRGIGSRPVSLLVALALLVVAVAIAALVAGSQRDRLPAVVPPPDDASPTAVATIPPDDVASTGLVAYVVGEPPPSDADCDETPWRCRHTNLWIADADGSDARPLLRETLDDTLIGWTPDGRGVVYLDGYGAFRVVAPDGTQLRELGTFDTLCDPRCTGIQSVAISPDGTRLAFAATRSPETGDTSVIAIVDLSTGQSTELASTATRTDGTSCDGAADEGVADPPVWSPDGTRLAFVRQMIGPPDDRGVCRSALFVVDVDGSDLRGIVPMDLHPLAPAWSPDGSRIAFHAATADPDGASPSIDIFSVRPDGTDLRRLTEDGHSAWPRWTRGGRLVVVRPRGDDLTTVDPWIMDADGANVARLPADDLAALSAVGCLECPYPSGRYAASWQPT